MKLLELKIPPPLLFLFSALLMWLTYRFCDSFNFYIPHRIALSVICFLAFSLLGFIALLTFIQANATVNPIRIEQTSRFVTHGVYRISRNPMYLSLTGILLAWGLFLTNVLALCLPIFFVLYITRFQIQPEEIILQRLFGEDFTQYRQKVRRWL